MLHKIIRATGFLWLFAIAVSLASAERTIPKPLPEHPGNIFLAGEQIGVVLHDEGDSGAWQVVDYDGKIIRQGSGAGRIRLGRLPVGYYEVRREGGEEAKRRPLTIGVLAPLRAPTPETSPVACDVGIAWSYPEREMPAAANLCALAGLNWVRDRFSWKELEPERGKLPERSRYDASADVQVAAGLKVLQVNHSVPPWAWAEGHRGRFPPDLRDAYNFYRRIAERWRGKILAIEPWNEADAWDFGNHTGSEMAAMQKASYLGLKAGNPAVVVGQNAFAALRRPTTLGDFHANRAWPYFDTFNFHTYDPFCNYPAMGAAFRAVSAGRPMWLTEVNVPVPFEEDDKFHEPSREDLRVQAERVTKIYALSFHEGSAATFFFYLPEFGRKLQFGLLRPDFTPRPGYLALAAVGRLLADARPLGRLKCATAGLSSSAGSQLGEYTAGQVGSATRSLHAYAFRAKPDGRRRTVVVAWSAEEPATLKLPAAPIAVYDHLGREMPKTASSVELSTGPVIALLTEEDAAKLNLELTPAPARWLEGKPSPIVLQALLPKKRVELKESAYRIARGKPDRIPIYVYNFGAEAADVRLAINGPEDWKPAMEGSVRVAAGDRLELGLSLDVPQSTDGIETIAIDADCGPAGEAVLSMRFMAE